MKECAKDDEDTTKNEKGSAVEACASNTEIPRRSVNSTTSNKSNNTNTTAPIRRIRKVPIVTTPTRGLSGASSSDDDDLDDDEELVEEGGDLNGTRRTISSGHSKIPSFHNSRGAPASSIFASSTLSHSDSHNHESSSSNCSQQQQQSSSNSSSGTNTTTAAAVQPDQERQILLLMLLAQVCALHDPTPRTFTVHVLELFERGILGRQSIHFLFELGLVPSTTPRLLTAHPHNSDNNTNNSNADSKEPDSVLELATVPVTAPLSPQTLRSQEASVIRSHLEQHDLAQQQQSSPLSSRANTNPNNSLIETPPKSTKSSSSWAVEHHPLSLSRYQREFHQVRLLNAGSFGEVFHSTNKVDLKDYAVKRVAFSAWGYSKDSLTQVIREVHCLAQCDHPNVVRYYTSWLEPSWMTGSGATINMTTATNGNDIRRQQKLLTDIQHMMISGARSSSEELQESATSTTNNSDSNNKRDFMRNRKFSIGSSLDSLDSASGESSYDETSSNDDEEESGWTLGRDDSHIAFDHDDDDDLFFESSRGGGKDGAASSSNFCSPAHRHDFNQHHHDNNKATRGTAKKTAARLKYRYQICLFIQMQLCQPATLGDWIRHRNSLVADSAVNRRERVEQAVHIFGQIVGGLQHIHKKNIVHRDLKPHNLFRSLEEEGVFLIGDFGLSKLIHSATHHSSSSANKKKQNHHHHHPEDFAAAQTSGGESNALVVHAPPIELTAGVGTASYAAPEQVTTSNYGNRADIFSLGLILLELLCCFGTEHERIQTFHDCRYRRDIPCWISQEYPVAAQTILRCTEPKAHNRPTAEELVGIDLLTNSLTIETSGPSSCGAAKVSSEKEPVQNKPNDDELLDLKRQLEEKDELILAYQKQLQEKDMMIQQLQEQLAASASQGQQQVPDDEVPQIQRVAFPTELMGASGMGIVEVDSSSSSSGDGQEGV